MLTLIRMIASHTSEKTYTKPVSRIFSIKTRSFKENGFLDAAYT